MTTISAACATQHPRTILLSSYPKEVRSAALHIFKTFAESNPGGRPCNSLREFSFQVGNHQDKSADLCSRATKTFELFATLLAHFNPDKTDLFKNVWGIGTDHVCLQMYEKNVAAFKGLNFQGPRDHLAEIQG